LTSRHALLRPKRQITIPKLPCEQAGVVPGDRMRVKADGPGRVVFERIEEAEVTAAAAVG
jgi:bifunctional DNA-binding transcriptional regulator/antitoxin component of YhaV-PrlF toxin-antitoxin module